MTDTYVLPGINVYPCPMCSRDGNNIFVSVTLERFTAVMIYGPYMMSGVCKACGRTSLVELARPAPPVPDPKKLSQIIRALARRLK